MRTIDDLQNSSEFDFSFETAEIGGDESLISDARSHTKPKEVVERKLQLALQNNRSRYLNFDSVTSN